MRIPHGWECTTYRCGTYNSIHFAECRVCGAPRDSGRILYTHAPGTAPRVAEPTIPPVAPASPLPAVPERWPGWLCALVVIGLIVIFLTSPGLCLIGLFFALLWSIAAGIWRIVGRFP